MNNGVNLNKINKLIRLFCLPASGVVVILDTTNVFCRRIA